MKVKNFIVSLFKALIIAVGKCAAVALMLLSSVIFCAFATFESVTFDCWRIGKMLFNKFYILYDICAQKSGIKDYR